MELLNPLPSSMPDDKRRTVEQIVNELIAAGVEAIALGGSYSRGTATAESDVDLGLYYHETQPLSIAAVRRVAEAVSKGRAPTVTEFYQWGAWVNGGAWIWTSTGKVDLLYRNIEHVERVIARAKAGESSSDYYQQPPYGFHSVIYLGETSVCVPLHDPSGILDNLKRQVVDYPPALRERILGDSLWSTEFTLKHAVSFAAKGDIYNTAGCLTRAAAMLTQSLYALNRVYFISDKGALAAIDSFPIRPPDYGARIAHILGSAGLTADELSGTVGRLSALFTEVVALAGEGYTGRYSL